MTRKQAIDEAWDVYIEGYDVDEVDGVIPGLNRAYDLGRVAGMREAARGWCISERPDRDEWARLLREGIRSNAESLLRKIRGAK